MLQLLTITDLANRIGEPAHVINYAVGRHGPRPSQRLGITRLWAESDIPAIEAALDKTAVNGRKRAPACA